MTSDLQLDDCVQNSLWCRSINTQVVVILRGHSLSVVESFCPQVQRQLLLVRATEGFTLYGLRVIRELYRFRVRLSLRLSYKRQQGRLCVYFVREIIFCKSQGVRVKGYKGGVGHKMVSTVTHGFYRPNPKPLNESSFFPSWGLVWWVKGVRLRSIRPFLVSLPRHSLDRHLLCLSSVEGTSPFYIFRLHEIFLLKVSQSSFIECIFAVGKGVDSVHTTSPLAYKILVI